MILSYNKRLDADGLKTASADQERRLARQAKLGASCRVEVPVG
jgi:hypothetical protein